MLSFSLARCKRPIMDQPGPPTAPSASSAEPRSFARSWQAMATQFELELIGPDAEHLEAVAAAIEDEIRRLEKLLSRHNPASEVSRINRGAAAAPLKVDADVWQLLTACEEFRHATDGFFDVTAAEAPPVDSLAASVPRLLLDPDRQTVRFYSTDVSIDFGAVGKGYALDRVRELIARFGVSSALVSGGSSSIVAVGRPAGGAWTVDVRHPADEGAPPVGRVELVDRSLSCSAAIRPGQVVSDIIDPHTQRPLVGKDAVVVLAPSGVAAEALSTALLAMGSIRAVEYLGRSQWTKVEQIDAAWIDGSAASPNLKWLTH
jgi:FAD:protein FMN transferase